MDDKCQYLKDSILMRLEDRGIKTSFVRPQQCAVLRISRSYEGRTLRSVLSMMDARQLTSILNRLENR